MTERWLVLYDADCGLCKWLLAGLLRWDRARRLRPLALQTPEAARLLEGMSPARRMASWHLISPSGGRRSAGDALAPLLRLLPGGGPPAAVFGRWPRVAERGYWWIADHRSQLSKGVPSSAKRRAVELIRRREQDCAR